MVSLIPSLHNMELSNPKIMDYTVKCFKFYVTTLFKRTWVGLSMLYQDKTDLTSFSCFRSHLLLLTALPSAALSQHSYLYQTSEMKPSIFFKSCHSSNKQPKKALGVGAVSLGFGKSPLFAQGSSRLTHTWQSPTRMQVCSRRGEILEHLEQFS